MIPGRLSPLQLHILSALSGMRPRWTLSGGGALVGFHTRHRETRDLDLFWQRTRELGTVAPDALRLLEAERLEVTVLQTHPAFARLQVRQADQETVVDLVADPVPLAEAPEERPVGTAHILVVPIRPSVP